MAKETSNFTSKQELQDYINSLKEIDSQYRELNRQAKLLASTPGAAKNAVLGQLKALRLQYDTHKEILASIRKAENELSSFAKTQEKAAKAAEKQAKAIDDLTDNFSELDSLQKSITNRYGDQSEETKRTLKNVDAIKATVGGIGKFLAKNVDLEEDQKEALSEAADYMKSMPVSFDKLNQKLLKGRIGIKQYNKYVQQIDDGWEEIVEKINFSDKKLRGFKTPFRKISEAQKISGQAARIYGENYSNLKNKSVQRQAAFGTLLGALPGGKELLDLVNYSDQEKLLRKNLQVKNSRFGNTGITASRVANSTLDPKDAAQLQELKNLKLLAYAGLGGAAAGTAFDLFREQMPGYYRISNMYAPKIAKAQGEVNLQQAIFNKNAKIFGGPLAKKYGAGFAYAAQANKDFQFSMQQLNAEFTKASKTAFFGGGIGNVRYDKGELQLAGVTAENIASTMTQIAGTANVNFFGSKEGLGAQAALFARQMGISGEDVGNIMAAFRRIAGYSGKTALNMEYSAAKMANEAGLNMGVVLNDMAEASKNLLSYNIQNADAFIKQAIAIRQMGGNLPQFAKGIKGSILNYRQSLEAQITLGNLLGRPVDFSVAQSLAYSGKYDEAFENIKQSGVLEAVRRGGLLAEDKFSQIFGMGLDDFQAAAEKQKGGKVNLKGTLDAQNKAFLSKTSTAQNAFMVETARIQVEKAVADANFAKVLAEGLNMYQPYLTAVNRLNALTSQMNTILSIYKGVLEGVGAYLGYRIGGGKSLFSPVMGIPGGNPYGFVDKNGKPLNNSQTNMKLTAGGTRTVAEGLQAMGLAKASRFGKFTSAFKSTLPFATVGAGLDMYGRYQQGQTNTQAILGSIVPTLTGAGAWATAAALGPETGGLSFLIPLIASMGTSYATSVGIDKLTGADKVGQQEQQIQQMQETPDAILQTLENIQYLMTDLVALQAQSQNKDVKVFLDGADITRSSIRKQLNMIGAIPGSTLGQALGIKK